jgi:F0F1-type ATP synthase epsilon subunit
MSNQALLQVKVRDTEKIIYEGSVDRISSYNEVGPFDIYPTHANFISILRREIAFYQKNQKVKELKIEQAVLKVKKDNVNIFLGIEMLLVDEEAAPAPHQQPTETK